MNVSLYHYKAIITGVYDGDTVTADIDLGFKTWKRGQKIRLAGIDAPEIRGPEKEAGEKALEYLKYMIGPGHIILETQKDKAGKYGRWLGILWVDKFGGWVNINKAMVNQGHAEIWKP